MNKRNYLKYLGFKTVEPVAASETGTAMTSLEYKELEQLLAKLQGEIGGNKICIIPHYLHDGYHIGIYSSESGAPIKSALGPNIQETVDKLKQQLNINEQTNVSGL